MSVFRRKYKAIIIIALIIFLPSLFQYALSQTPPGPNTLEHGEGINFPTITAINGYYLGATEITDRLQGTWDVALTAPTLDTGQGANELYDMDQNVLTTSDVDFNSIDSTEFYWNSANRTDVLAHPEGEAVFLVYNESGTINLKNLRTGQIDGSSGDADTVINWAIGNLTSGRSYYEEIFLKGYFTIDNQISLANYTIIDLCGSTIYLANGADAPIFNLQDVSYVEIKNGFIDGNKGNQGTNVHGIRIYAQNMNNTDIRLYNLKIKDINGHCILASGSGSYYNHRIFTTETITEGYPANYGGIIYYYVYTGLIDDVITDGKDQVGKYGVECVYGGDILLSNIISIGNEYGVYIGQSTGSTIKRVVLSNYDIIDCNKGLVLERTLEMGEVGKGVIYNTTSDGIQAYSGNIDGAHIKLAGRHGTYFSGNSTTIRNSIIENSSQYDIYLEDGKVNNKIIDNELKSTNTIRLGGINYEIRDNSGFITENWGNSTMANGGWITHGLAGTPDYIQLTADISDSAYAVQVQSQNSTMFQVYLYDIVAGEVEAVAKPIQWYAKYEP